MVEVANEVIYIHESKQLTKALRKSFSTNYRQVSLFRNNNNCKYAANLGCSSIAKSNLICNLYLIPLKVTRKMAKIG